MRWFLLTLVLFLPSTVDAVSTGLTAPDGTRPAIELPESLRKKNIPSGGAGCCVFRSIEYAAHWQNLPQFDGFPEWMVAKGIRGGGWPSKVDELIPKICADRGLPVPDYIQIEGRDLDLIRLAVKTGRMPCVTYGGNHMLSVVHADDKWFGLLDNNRIDTYEWRTEAEMLRSYIGPPHPLIPNPQGWAIIFLSPGPPPSPWNGDDRPTPPTPPPSPKRPP